MRRLRGSSLKLTAITLIILSLLFLPLSLPLKLIAMDYRSVSLLVPAVVTLQNGTEIGVTAKLTVYTAPGQGNVYIATNPIAGIDTEAAARIAFLVATYLAGVNPYKVNAYISFSTSSLMIEGPSAGVAMAVAILASLRGDHLRNDVIVTGMVNPDGTVGPVGGLLAKLQAAAKSGAKYFLIPLGQRYTYVTKIVKKQVGPITITKEEAVPVDLAKVGKKLGVKVVEISTVRQAYEYFTGVKLPVENISNISLPACLSKVMSSITSYYINSAKSYINKTVKVLNLLSSTERLYVKELIKAAENYVNESMKYKDLPYVSASKGFGAAIEASYAFYSSQVLAGIDPKIIVNELLNNATKILNETSSVIRELPRSYGDLEVKIAVATRIEMAKDSIAEAKSLLASNRILDNAITGEWGAIHEAVYAYWRAHSSLDWSEMLSCVAPGNTDNAMSYEALRDLALFALYYSGSVVSYASSLLKDIGASQASLNTANSYYNKANELFSRGDMYASIGYSLESIAYAVITIDSTFVSNISEMVNAAKSETLDALARLYSINITPPLSLSYLEFALVQGNDINKLYYFELSGSYMKLLYYASGLFAGTNQMSSEANVTTTHIPVYPTNTTTKSQVSNITGKGSYMVTAFLLLILGLVIGFIIGRISKE